MPVQEYNELEVRARKATPRDQSSFMVPWLAEHASPAQRKAWFGSAPPLRFVYFVTRRRYRRLDAALVAAT
jgi:secreted protein with Ig-like and vWFA domain